MNEFRRPLRRRRRLYEAPLTTATTIKTSPIIGGTTTVIMGGGGGRRLSGDDGDVNILLLVGAVGAGVSLLLLVIGLCRARRVHHATTGNVGGEVEERRRRKTTTTTKKCTSKKMSRTANNSDDVVTFEPGKNNPGRRHGWFRRPSGIDGNNTTSLSGSPLRPPPPPAFFPPTNNNSRPNTPNQYHHTDDDDESNADFVLARAALGNNNDGYDNANKYGGGESLEDGDDVESLGGESFGYTVDGESSLAASRNATKYINGVAAAAAAIPGTTNEDSAIGAGGISSFTNDRGIFRWNENGTKMVYTPTNTATLRKTGGGVAVAVVGEEQNGFIFDERKKKWVVKEKIVGGKTSKNVSFPSSTAALITSTNIKRVRSNESTAGGSVISGMTGMSEFTYDQIGRSNNTTTTTTTNDNGRKVIMTKNKKAASPNTPDETEEGFEISSSMGITLTPLTPATVYDDTNDNDAIDDIDQLLLLRVGPTTLSTPTRNEHSNNNNNNNDDLDDDGSTSMMTGFTDIYESNTALSGLTNIVTPERNGGDSYRYTANNDDDCGSSVRTGDPGRITPKTRKKFEPRPQQQLQQPSSSDGGGGGGMFFGAGRPRSVITAAPSMLKISEDTPFDEDIPFDERSKINNNNDNDRQLLHRPELNDDDDDAYEDDESQGSANSEHVLKDLHSLSKFMYERKRSEKKNRGRVGVGARGSGGWDDSRTSSARFGGAGRTITSSSTAGRKSSFGSRGI